MKRNLRKNINMNINISTKTIRRMENYQLKKKKNLLKINLLRKNLLKPKRLKNQKRMKILTTGGKHH